MYESTRWLCKHFFACVCSQHVCIHSCAVCLVKVITALVLSTYQAAAPCGLLVYTAFLCGVKGHTWNYCAEEGEPGDEASRLQL